MTQEYWEFVAKDVNSFANSGDDEYCLKILSLSYSHLPIHLKPCFLCMRVFPEDSEIRVSKLIRLCFAEGFLKSTKDKTLEEIAHEYLKDLIGRNLILIRRLRDTRKIKTCSMHDLLRDLCIRESDKEHFYPALRSRFIEYDDIGTTCFLCSDGNALLTMTYLPQLAVSSQPKSRVSCVVCDNCRITYPQLNKLKMVKILDTSSTYSSEVDIPQPAKLSVLSIVGDCKFVDNSIRLLWNLQTLYFFNPDVIVLPSEIWELPQLRHLRTSPCVLPDPHPITHVDKKDSAIILKNLQKLSKVRDFRLSKDAIERIPNLKKLGIQYFDRVLKMSCNSLHNLGLLHKLQSFNLETQQDHTLKNIPFPHSLKKITLSQCKIPSEEMAAIGSLPNLEVLVIFNVAFKGPEWNPIEGGFPRLKKLSILHNDLVRWGAEKIHYPHLEILELYFMKYLEEIPSSIGEIETLRLIRLFSCNDSVVNSAKEILEEQRSFGNEDLQLYVEHAWYMLSST